MQADASSEGNPEIRPGKVIKLEEIGKYSGSYYVTQTVSSMGDLSITSMGNMELQATGQITVKGMMIHLN